MTHKSSRRASTSGSVTAEPDGAGDGLQRVLLVSHDDDFSRWINKALRGAAQRNSIERVDGYLMALGTIAVHGEPRVIVGRSDTPGTFAEATTRALRRLAPRARLLLVVRRGDELLAEGAIGAGFDDRITETSSIQAIQQAVAGYDGRRDCDESGQISGSSPVMCGHALGDVDLIERMLTSRQSIQDVALDMAKLHSGISALKWAARPEDVPENHVAAPVAYSQSQHGLLHGPKPLTVSQLSPWAAWLGRWLALEQRLEALWKMAMRDDLAGVWNRRYFTRFLTTILQRAALERFNVTLMVFDIDDFKVYNDRYGHSAGDEILREVARLMVSVVREHDVVARIGGDEFGVIFWDAEAPRRPDSEHPHKVVQAAQRFQRAICDHKFPKLDDAHATLTTSGGLAGFPWDGRAADELLEQADQMALCSKQQGKNAFTFGPGAQRVCRVNSNGDVRC